MSKQYAGINTLLKMGNGSSPEVFTTVAAMGNIDLGELKAKNYDTTNHDNTTGYSTFINGLKDGGAVTGTLYFDATEATHKDATGGLLGQFNASAVCNWQLAPAGYSPAVKWSFAGVITKLGKFKYPVDGVQTADIEITISGKPALA